MTSLSDGPEAALTAHSILKPDWPAPATVRAAMTLRTGGVSTAPYDSLNLGTHVGDNPAHVAENRQRVRDSLQLPSEPMWLEQVHGTSAVLLEATTKSPQSPGGSSVSATGATSPLRADAAVTRRLGAVCAIQVADCMPVLFASTDGAVIGAAHAGWRGLAGGVLESTVTAMGHAAGNLIAWLGPTISQPYFEVGDEVRTAFIETDSKSASAFTRNTRNRWQCDLYSLARQRLTTLGIRHISGGGWCTYAERDRFFSYRRDGQCGRMAALIWLSPS